MTTEMREHVVRDRTVVSLSVALAVMKKFERDFYARIGTKRQMARGMDKVEGVAIASMTTALAKHFSPFAVYVDETAYHWEIVQPIVQQVLIAVPMDMRAALTKNGQKVSHEIAQRIFDAVDREFRLVPLEGQPKMHGEDPWEKIFLREHGHASSRLGA